MGKYSPLTLRDVQAGLTQAGFVCESSEGGHFKWVGMYRGKRRVVTVDNHLAPFSVILADYMAEQAGMSKKEFRELCSPQGAKKAKKGLLSWLLPSPD